MLPKPITNYITYLCLTVKKNSNLINSAAKMKLFHGVVLNAMKNQIAEIFITVFSRRRFINAGFSFLETNWTNVHCLRSLTGAREHRKEHRQFKQVACPLNNYRIGMK